MRSRTGGECERRLQGTGVRHRRGRSLACKGSDATGESVQRSCERESGDGMSGYLPVQDKRRAPKARRTCMSRGADAHKQRARRRGGEREYPASTGECSGGQRRGRKQAKGKAKPRGAGSQKVRRERPTATAEWRPATSSECGREGDRRRAKGKGESRARRVGRERAADGRRSIDRIVSRHRVGARRWTGERLFCSFFLDLTGQRSACSILLPPLREC